MSSSGHISAEPHRIEINFQRKARQGKRKARQGKQSQPVETGSSAQSERSIATTSSSRKRSRVISESEFVKDINGKEQNTDHQSKRRKIEETDSTHKTDNVKGRVTSNSDQALARQREKGNKKVAKNQNQFQGDNQTLNESTNGDRKEKQQWDAAISSPHRKQKNRKTAQHERGKSSSSLSLSMSPSSQVKSKAAVQGIQLPGKKLTPQQAAQARMATLREKMTKKLSGARFRWINEKLYTTTSEDALHMYQENEEMFHEYHHGYREQVAMWPLNPLDTIITELRQLATGNKGKGKKGKAKRNELKEDDRVGKRLCIADFGCGEGRLARELHHLHQVHAFDLVSANEYVTVADSAHVPLQHSTVDVAVFCLSLMGTNYIDFLLEANRVLKVGGLLKIAEVRSRFADSTYKAFQDTLSKVGFECVHPPKEVSTMFVLFECRKVSPVSKTARKRLKEHVVELEPCHYKKR